MNKEFEQMEKQENEIKVKKECENFEKIAFLYVKFFKESVANKSENEQ
jgi:hypothetical protein